MTRTTLIGISSPALAEARPSGLLVIASPQPLLVGNFFELTGAQAIIGRDPAAEVQIGDDGISRSHVRIERRENNEFFAVDLSSTNGTWLNGVRIRSAVLVDGDLLEIGTGTKLRFGPRPEGKEHVVASPTPAPPGTGAFEYDAGSRRLSIIGSIAPFMGMDTGTGPRPDGALGRVYEEDRQGLRAGLETALESGSCELEFRVVGPHGETAWVAMRGQTWRDKDGAPIRIAGTVTAISERNRAEFELRRQPLFFDSQTDAIAVIGVDGKIYDWNPAAERLFGWSKIEALGTLPEMLLHPSLPDALDVSGVAVGRRFEATLTLTRKSGAPIEIEAVGVPLKDPDGASRNRVLLLRDEGQRRRAVAQMQMTERLASIGTLAAGVAHE
ncbi:MAG TPA: PAS domain S-box protein, partial [Anaeromyxobacteraceae bacterium]|nr:PAS domain S-box protein [Anaeromyxobacteraceae bacterium]